jgi:hypothetical protein
MKTPFKLSGMNYQLRISPTFENQRIPKDTLILAGLEKGDKNRKV